MKTTWRIANLKRDQTTGLVFELSYLIMFELEDQKAHYFETIPINGSLDDQDFVPFENLTEDIVITWVKSIVGEEKIADLENKTRLILEEKIAKKIEQSFVEGLPWNQ
jgi:hypothetical protein